MKKIIIFLAVVIAGIVVACNSKPTKPKLAGGTSVQLSDDSLLTLIQYKTFQYFWEGAEPNSGMARERYHVNNVYPENDMNIVTIGGTGFGVMAIIVGIERGFITREEGFQHLSKIVSFLTKADRFHGAWPHWLDGETGKVKPFSTHDNGGDLVETSFLVQGLIAVKQYFIQGNEAERALSLQIAKLCNEVEWSWYQNGQKAIYWHWSPNYEWKMNFAIKGYNECLITYVLGASSATYPVDPAAYHTTWAMDGAIKSAHEKYGYKLSMVHQACPEYGGPLFWEHYSFLGLDPRKLKDNYANYWEHNRNHVLINRQYCIENPKQYKGYGEGSWGLTSSYSIPNFAEAEKNHTDFGSIGNDGFGYAGHCPCEDLSVISPTAALSSFPYAPAECMKAARYMHEVLGDRLFGKFGFYDAYSEQFNWFPQKYLAIDQGPIVVMIENYRSGLLWKLFMSDTDVQNGLNKLGFQYQ